MRRRARRCRVCSIVRVVRVARRASLPRARRGDLRLPPPDRLGATLGRGCDRVRALDRLEGAEAGRDLSGQRAQCGSRRTGTSGPAPVTCCTWTPASTRASNGQATASPATARSQDRYAPRRCRLRARDRRRPLAGSPMPRSTTTRKPRPSSASSTRALAFYADHGITAEATDDRQRLGLRPKPRLRRLLSRRQIHHLTTKPYRPRTNGKVERFHQTMAREWAYGLTYDSHRERPRPATLAPPLRMKVKCWTLGGSFARVRVGCG